VSAFAAGRFLTGLAVSAGVGSVGAGLGRVGAFAAGRFLTGLAVSAGVSALVFAAAWLAARRAGRWNVVDVAWGLSFVLIGAAAFGWSSPSPASSARRLLVLVMVAVWGLRLAGYIWLRSRGGGEDPRYAAIMSRARGSKQLYAIRVVFAPQALLAWFVSLPVQAAMYERADPGVLAWAGAAVWAVGLFFEAVGDAQMAAFRREPANRGRVMDHGLWRYTRHPNYFGDASVWVGLYLVAASTWQGALTFLSPLAMLYFLYFKSGKGLLEKDLSRSKPGYAEYVRRTSGFLPLPPRRPAG
jgi:steroid 5-alpha reductase family enzyme